MREERRIYAATVAEWSTGDHLPYRYHYTITDWVSRQAFLVQFASQYCFCLTWLRV